MTATQGFSVIRLVPRWALKGLAGRQKNPWRELFVWESEDRRQRGRRSADDNGGLSPTSHSVEGTLRSCLSHYKTNLENNCALCEMCSDRKQTNLLSDMALTFMQRFHLQYDIVFVTVIFTAACVWKKRKPKQQKQKISAVTVKAGSTFWWPQSVQRCVNQSRGSKWWHNLTSHCGCRYVNEVRPLTTQGFPLTTDLVWRQPITPFTSQTSSCLPYLFSLFLDQSGAFMS